MTVVFDPGKAKHPIVIEEKRKSNDGGGSAVEKWVGWGTDRAIMLPISASERIRGMEREMLSTHLFEIRYRPGVLPSMRITISKNSEDRAFDIVSIINVEEADVKLQIICTEISDS